MVRSPNDKLMVETSTVFWVMVTAETTERRYVMAVANARNPGFMVWGWRSEL